MTPALAFPRSLELRCAAVFLAALAVVMVIAYAQTIWINRRPPVPFDDEEESR